MAQKRTRFLYLFLAALKQRGFIRCGREEHVGNAVCRHRLEDLRAGLVAPASLTVESTFGVDVFVLAALLLRVHALIEALAGSAGVIVVDINRSTQRTQRRA